MKNKKTKSAPAKKTRHRQAMVKTYKKLHHQKDVFAGGFFSVIALVILFFALPLPESLKEHIGTWRVLTFSLLLFLIIGWVITSSRYYRFCIKILKKEFKEGRITHKVSQKITHYAPSTVILILALSVFIPIITISYIKLIDLHTLYIVLGFFAFLSITIFLINIETYKKKEEELEEIEILAHAVIEHNPHGLLEEIKIDLKKGNLVIHHER